MAALDFPASPTVNQTYTANGATWRWNGTTWVSANTLIVPSGGTGATTLSGVVKGNGTSAFTAANVSLTTEVTGTLPVGNGGTGATTITANRLVRGNGTSAFTASGIHDAASGEVVRIDGTSVGIGTTTPAARLHAQLATSFAWGGGWGSGVVAFGGGTSTSGALAISYNDTDGAVLGCITPGVAWRRVSIFSGDIDLCSNGSNARMRIKGNGQTRFIPLSSAPAGAEAGDVYYDSSTNKLRCYNGTTWNDLF
jgi:hypothetical protein